MMEIASYFDAVKDRYGLSSDYALAEKLGIAQPEANLMRRGLKIPKPELCIKMAKLFDKNPVELLLVAQKDKAPSAAKEYWTLARTAVDVMLHVHRHGVGICGVYTFEVAETKVAQVIELARRHQHPLQCTMEKE